MEYGPQLCGERSSADERDHSPHAGAPRRRQEATVVDLIDEKLAIRLCLRPTRGGVCDAAWTSVEIAAAGARGAPDPISC